MFVIKTPGGKIKYKLSKIFNMDLLLGTIFDPETAKFFKQDDEYELLFEKSIVEHLMIPYLRSGKVYISTNINNPEFIELLDYLKGNNDVLNKCLQILKVGAMDLFGRHIRKNEIDFISFETFYLLPWNEIESKRRGQEFEKKTSTYITNTTGSLQYLFLRRKKGQSFGFNLNNILNDEIKTEEAFMKKIIEQIKS